MAQIFTELLAWKYFHMCLRAQSKMWVPALLLCLLLLNRHKRLINKVFLMFTKRSSLDVALGEDSWSKCVSWRGHLLSLWLTELFIKQCVFSLGPGDHSWTAPVPSSVKGLTFVKFPLLERQVLKIAVSDLENRISWLLKRHLNRLYSKLFRGKREVHF